MLHSAGRALLRRVVYPVTELIWCGAFYLAGRFGSYRRRVRYLTFRGATQVGIIAPHPDDEVAGCGGVTALHVAGGDSVSLLIVTDGSASRSGGLGRDAMALQRADEARAAARTLGITSVELAGLPEGAWEISNGSAIIAKWLATCEPAVIYAPSCIDYHPEHLRVARALAHALSSSDLFPPPIIRVYEIFVPLGPSLITDVAGISQVYGTKSMALTCYRSQANGLAQIPRRDRYVAQSYGLSRAAEGFWTLTAKQYARLIALGDWTGQPSAFRGLRARPFSDPLAYVVGNSTRERFRGDLDGPN